MKFHLCALFFSFFALLCAVPASAQTENSCKRTYRADMASGGFTTELINGFQRELFECQFSEIKKTSSITNHMCRNINASCSGFRAGSSSYKHCAEVRQKCDNRIGRSWEDPKATHPPQSLSNSQKAPQNVQLKMRPVSPAKCSNEGGVRMTISGDDKCFFSNERILDIDDTQNNSNAGNQLHETINDHFDEIRLGAECLERGGSMVDTTCVDEKNAVDTQNEDEIRKKLGTDLETMKAVSDLGQRNATKCVGAQADTNGWIEVQNICGKRVSFGFCYTDWVPNPQMASSSNPFTCDTTDKVAWGGADGVAGSDSWRAPLQAGSKSRKLVFGPCMSEVIYNDRTYSYTHSKRVSVAFRGRTGKYKCIYSKSGG